MWIQTSLQMTLGVSVFFDEVKQIHMWITELGRAKVTQMFVQCPCQKGIKRYIRKIKETPLFTAKF